MIAVSPPAGACLQATGGDLNSVACNQASRGLSIRLHRLLSASAFLLGAAVAPAVPAHFPVRPSDNARFLVDAAGRPFPILGRSSWYLAHLSPADLDVYLADSVQRGYTALEFSFIGRDPRGRHVPFNHRKQAPFRKRLDGQRWDGTLTYTDAAKEAPDFTTPNEEYWQDLDAVLARCERAGMLAFVFPAYVGYGGNTAQGWMKELEVNGPERLRAYGEWVARRYRRQANLVWMLGGDHGKFQPAQAAAEQGLIDGLLAGGAGGPLKLRSAEWESETISTDDPDFGRYITLNGAYSFDGYTADHARRAYAFTPVRPAYLLEEPYDEEHVDGTNVNPHASQPVRRFQWWGWLGAIGGYIAGNGYLWPFADDAWKQHLDTPGQRDMGHLNAFVRSIAWETLVPSGLGGQRVLITKNTSQERAPDYVAAAAALDGSLLVAYSPPDRWGPFEVDLAALRGPIHARWFDPTAGTYQEIAPALPNTGPHAFTPPGKNAAGAADWVLVLTAAE